MFLPNRHFEVTLTRAELEGMIRAPIESTIGTLDRVLSAARVDRTTLAAVLLVGGSSRIPLVAQMVSEAFGRPTVVGAHPKHAVALGAALLAEDRRKGTTGAAAARADGVREPGESVAAGNAPAAWVAPPASAAMSPLPATGTPAPGTPQTAGAGAVTLLPATQADGAGVSNLVPAPRAGDSLGGTALPGDRGQLPPQQGGPPDAPFAGPGDLPPEVPAPSPSVRRRNRWVALVVGLLLLVGAGIGLLVYLNLQPSTPQHQAGASGPAAASGSHPASAPPTATAVAPAVPIPSLGPVLPVGKTPNFVVAAPNGRQLYIASRDAGLVTVVDTAVNKVTGTIPIKAGPPQFLAFSKDGRRVYVSVWNDARTIAAVSVLDTTSNSIIDTIRVHTRPFLAAVSPDGKRVYVPNHDTGTVSVIDTATNKVVSEFTVPANPHSIAFTPDGSRVYIADHESNVVSVVDTATDKLVTTIPVPSSPHNVAVHPTRPLAIVASFGAGSVSAIDTNTNKVIRTIPVGVNPQHVAWSADGRFAYITNDASNNVSVIDANTLTVTATIPTGRAPTSMAVLPNGKVGYVSNLDDGTLTVLNLAG